jgi:hypothetical protein
MVTKATAASLRGSEESYKLKYFNALDGAHAGITFGA